MRHIITFVFLLVFQMVLFAQIDILDMQNSKHPDFKAKSDIFFKSDFDKYEKELNQVPFSNTKPSESYFNYKNTKNEIVIGNGTLTSERYPIYPYYVYSYSQSIYLAEEIGSPGTITKIKYFFAGSSLPKSERWAVYMGNTSKSIISDNDDWVPVSQMTQVFNGVISWAANSWIEITLSTPFNYNGYDNLVIAVNEYQWGFDGSGDRFYNTQVSTTRSMIHYEDNFEIYPSNPPIADNIQNVIPNIILTMTPATLLNHDLALGPISDISGFVGTNDTLKPKVKIFNLGQNDETTYSVNFKIVDQNNYELYNETINNPPAINSLSNVDISFPYWIADPKGSYTCVATVSLATDNDNSNNGKSIDLEVVDVIKAFAWDVYHNLAPNITTLGPINVFLPIGKLSQIAENTSDVIVAADYVLDEIYGTLYNSSPNPYSIVKIDPVTGTITNIGGGAPGLSGLAYDITSGTTYAMDLSGVLYTVDLTTGNTTLIGGNYPDCVGLACSPTGILYAISYGSDNLAVIDKTTGAATIVGPLGVDIFNAQGIAYDRNNNILYGTLFKSSYIGGLYSIDINTGTATLIKNIFDEIIGFAIPYFYGGANITFNVTDDNSQPISYASVNIDARNFLSNISGSASTYIAPGNYNFSVSKTGYADSTGNITVVEGANQVLNIVLHTPTSINEIKDNVFVYPNPSCDFINVNAVGKYNAKLLDINGRIVFEQNANDNTRLNLSNLPNGVYMLQLTFEKDVNTFKVIKQ